MDYELIIEGLKFVAYLIMGGLVLYFKLSATAQTKGKQVQQTIAELTAKAVVFIKEAEETYKDTTNAGGEKFALVVARLHGLVPEPLQVIITEEMIGNIVQSTFNEIEEYVKLQLDKTIESLDAE